MNMIAKPQAITLRPYQEEAVDKLWQFLISGPGNPLAVLPTGTGKSLCIAEFCKRMLTDYPDARIFVVTHAQELVSQNHAELKGIWPQAPAGIHNAGLSQWDVTSPIIFGSIQSMHKKAFKLQKCDIIIVDEAQSIPRKASTTWLRFIADVQAINPYLRVVGTTATAYRTDSGYLHKGKDRIFTDIAYEYSVIDAIKEGYLTEPVTRHSATQIDTSGVHVRAGEFVANELSEVACNPDVVQAIVDELVREGADRDGWIVFGANVKHCMMLRDEIMSRGFTCEGVFSQEPENYAGGMKYDRKRFVEDFRAKKIRCLVSVNALTVGFNAKHVGVVGLARPTCSPGLYVQSVGRGTRVVYAPGFDLSTREGRLLAIANGPKPNCKILDFGGNSQRHGLIDRPNIREPGQGDGAIPYKTCAVCGVENFIAARLCKECGEPFDIEGTKVSVVAASGPLLSSQAVKPEWITVNSVQYDIHRKPDKPPSLRVTYHCGLLMHREWICLEHEGYARSNAIAWWQKRAGTQPPETIAEAIERKSELRTPTQIAVRRNPANNKFTEIVGSVL
jgi:DNA repair protein RadD